MIFFVIQFKLAEHECNKVDGVANSIKYCYKEINGEIYQGTVVTVDGIDKFVRIGR